MNLKSLTIILITILSISLETPALAASFSTAGATYNKKVEPMNIIKRKNIVTQSLDFSCGAAGLSTLFNFYLDQPVSEIQIIETLLNIVPLEKVKARRGFSLLDLKRFAESQGYVVNGYQMDIEFLKDLGKPALVPIKFKNYRHFVIVKGIIANRVFIADPAAGNVSLTIDQFKHMWTQGIGLVVESHKDRPLQYALKVEEDDILVSDYKRIRNLINNGLMQTTIFPSEF